MKLLAKTRKTKNVAYPTHVFNFFVSEISQVVQVLTAKDAKKSSRISNSYQLQLLYDVQGQHSVTGEAEKMQNPSLDQRIMGLHKPRSIRDE